MTFVTRENDYFWFIFRQNLSRPIQGKTGKKSTSGFLG